MNELSIDNVKNGLVKIHGEFTDKNESPIVAPKDAFKVEGNIDNNNRVIISAPHAIRTLRNGGRIGGEIINEHCQDEWTGEIAKFIQEKTQCCIIYTSGKSRDPNYYNFCDDDKSEDKSVLIKDDNPKDETLPYKHKLLELIIQKENNKKIVVIDLHGASNNSFNEDLAFGFNQDAENFLDSTKLGGDVSNNFESFFSPKITTTRDSKFTASDPARITRFVYSRKKSDVTAIQIEASKNIRDPTDNINKVTAFVTALITIVNNLNGVEEEDFSESAGASSSSSADFVATNSSADIDLVSSDTPPVTPPPASSDATPSDTSSATPHESTPHRTASIPETPNEPDGDFNKQWWLFDNEDDFNKAKNYNLSPDKLSTQRIGKHLTDIKRTKIDSKFTDESNQEINAGKIVGLGACHNSNQDFWKWDKWEIDSPKLKITGRIINGDATLANRFNTGESGTTINSASEGNNLDEVHILKSDPIIKLLQNGNEVHDVNINYDNATGKFTIEDVRPGDDYQVNVEYNGNTYVHDDNKRPFNRTEGTNTSPDGVINIKNKNHEGVVVDVAAGTHTIFGRIIDGNATTAANNSTGQYLNNPGSGDVVGLDIPAGNIELLQYGNPIGLNAVPNADGTFSIPNVPDGNNYQVRVTYPVAGAPYTHNDRARHYNRTANFDIAPDGFINIAGADHHGVVVDVDDGIDPSNNLLVYPKPADNLHDTPRTEPFGANNNISLVPSNQQHRQVQHFLFYRRETGIQQDVYWNIQILDPNNNPLSEERLSQWNVTVLLVAVHTGDDSLNGVRLRFIYKNLIRYLLNERNYDNELIHINYHRNRRRFRYAILFHPPLNYEDNILVPQGKYKLQVNAYSDNNYITLLDYNYIDFIVNSVEGGADIPERPDEAE